MKVRGKMEIRNIAEGHLQELRQLNREQEGRGSHLVSFSQFRFINLSPLCSVSKPLSHKSNGSLLIFINIYKNRFSQNVKCHINMAFF